MARTNPIPVRVDDNEKAFLEIIANKDMRHPATIAYLALKNYLDEHGYDPDQDYEAILQAAKSKKKSL